MSVSIIFTTSQINALIKKFTHICIKYIFYIVSTYNSDSFYFQAPEEIKEKIKETSKEMSIECGKALKELSNSVRKMNLPISADEHITNAKKSAKNLNSLLKSGINNWEEINLLQVIPLATIASILTDIVICVDEIGQGVNELATLAHFKKSNNKEITTKVVEKIELSNNNIIEGSRKVHDCSSHDVVITINESNMKL